MDSYKLLKLYTFNIKPLLETCVNKKFELKKEGNLYIEYMNINVSDEVHRYTISIGCLYYD